MGLKVGSSENVGLPELISVIREFERTNSVQLEISSELVTKGSRVDWEWTIGAYHVKNGVAAALPLALVKRRCMESRLVTVEALLFQLLYSMDFELGLLEFQDTDETE